MIQISKQVLAFLLMIIFAAPVAAAPAGDLGNTTVQSFNKAKKVLLRVVYEGHRQTFYCGSEFDQDKRVTHSGGYKPKKENGRAYRLEWEHVVPAHAFGQSFREWRDGDPECVDSKGKAFRGRKCAEKMNADFRFMQADMHNLVPAIGELNGLRSNYSFAMIPGEKRSFGSCDMEIEDRKAEPPPRVWGDIARIYFYMDSAYPGRGVISRKNRKMFEAWNEGDPVDAWECERSRLVEELQGNENPFVKSACQDEGLW